MAGAQRETECRAKSEMSVLVFVLRARGHPSGVSS